ncbi:MAG: glutathione S-transferase family protein [Candidatus Omnitrophica bacterium]|nr:glutathione S-transferase family protein [Candidatus Omnitrophota bacterium]
MLKLFCFQRSGNSREVKIVLAEKNIPFESINIHGDKRATESPEFLKASPQKKVPAIIDSDVYMSEAFLINQYLDQKYPHPSLMPKDESSREAIRRFVAEIDKKMVLNIGLLVIECLLKPKPEQREDFKEKKRVEVREGLRELDRMLEGKEYLFGDFSLADVAVTPHISALPILGTGIPAEFKNATNWFERIKARPSFQQSAQ